MLFDNSYYFYYCYDIYEWLLNLRLIMVGYSAVDIKIMVATNTTKSFSEGIIKQSGSCLVMILIVNHA